MAPSPPLRGNVVELTILCRRVCASCTHRLLDINGAWKSATHLPLISTTLTLTLSHKWARELKTQVMPDYSIYEFIISFRSATSHNPDIQFSKNLRFFQSLLSDLRTHI